MNTQIHLCGPEDRAPLLSLVARCHDERGTRLDDDARDAAILPLLEGSPLGAAYIFGPRRAPIGYVIVTFGWSVPLGGMEGTVDEVFVRPSVRRRGIGGSILHEIGAALADAGLRALHMRVDAADAPALSLGRRAGFTPRDEARHLVRLL